MKDLLELADPAAGVIADASSIRSRVDERIGLAASARPRAAQKRRPWILAAASFVTVLAMAIPVALLRGPSLRQPSDNAGVIALPGIEESVSLASGGVQTTAVDGDAIWVLTSLAHSLQRVSLSTGQIERQFAIDAYAEGVVVGGGYIWLMSYDNGGEVLRFDPSIGRVDLSIPLGAKPGLGFADWFANRLWVSNDRGELVQIGADGAILEIGPGALKGAGLGYHWVNDPKTGLINSLSDDGIVGQLVVPTDGTVTSTGSEIRSVVEAGGYLWLMDGDFPFTSAVTRFDPASGELSPLSIATGLLGMTEHDGYLWVTSSTDNVLIRVDPASGELTRFPMPGKAAGVLSADGALWLTLYHPGALIRVDADAGLVESAPVVVDSSVDGNRLLCTGERKLEDPAVILEPTGWIDYGSWSVVQAALSNAGYLVCAHGYLDEDPSAEQRADDLKRSLDDSGIGAPYVLVGSGDGAHTVRLFADGLGDGITGAVLVDPTPLGFEAFLDDELDRAEGHPPWNDLSPEISDSLTDLGSRPLVVIGHDPDTTYLSPAFVEYAGEQTAVAINDYWQAGLRFYAGLSTNSRRTVANGSADVSILWEHSNLVVEEVISILP